jgi:hypothetical protein
MKRTPIRSKRTKPRKGAISVRRDGREVCEHNGIEYKMRIIAMVKRQRGLCCLYGHSPHCPGHISEAEATFEHEDGRGMGGGRRDDRIVLPDGRWINGAAHALCNQWKGSRRIDYNTALQQAAQGVTTPIRSKA